MTAETTLQPATPVALRQRLSEAGFELAGEFGSLPPGAVLRCFSRAVRTARLAGTDPAEVVAVARCAAELRLETRLGSQTPGSVR
jgi:hypothetical protein